MFSWKLAFVIQLNLKRQHKFQEKLVFQDTLPLEYFLARTRSTAHKQVSQVFLLHYNVYKTRRWKTLQLAT